MLLLLKAGWWFAFLGLEWDFDDGGSSGDGWSLGMSSNSGDSGA